ncbi:MAG: Ig-like domain-containing protein [Thermoleophilia bacterium]|jgi:protocatechuate 3,4-dioxygenase beta subunit
MQKRTFKVMLLAILALILVLGFSGTALADQTWPDLPDTVTAKYGITDNQVAAISDGYPNGLWKPYQSITREQFTKMAVEAFNIHLKDPDVPSFSDVPKNSIYYKYIEGAKAAGIINGTTTTTFAPKNTITRVQALAIIARYVSDANGYDLATMYTDDEIDYLLSYFGDKGAIAPELKNEVAFAYDFGITLGDAYGNLAPATLLTRIQAAAMLIRATEIAPLDPDFEFTADKIELVSADKSENLIGQTHTATFKVTDSAGQPVAGVLVDFDTLFADPLYVGNISPQAAVTDTLGEVKVNLISHEPGTEKVSATVRTADGGLATQVVTKYWLVLDEVYLVTDNVTPRNNVGVPHSFSARVLVMGPGPRSTTQYDWYNWISTAPFDPSDIKVNDGIDGPDDDADYADEVAQAAQGFVPRTLAGIDVNWSIYDTDDTDETVTSVGDITEVDGVAISPAKTAVGKTDDDGLSSIVIESEDTGVTQVMAVADYPENPYPKLLFNHIETFVSDWEHYNNWDEQPADAALAVKTWIPHTAPDGPTNISPADLTLNIGEEELLTITLKDQYGNPISGASVEWSMQGVGQFKSDDEETVSDDGLPFGTDLDYDKTDAAGTARLLIKSLDPGQQIIEAKYIDPKTGKATIDTAHVQWYKVNIATFDDPTTVSTNEAVSTNEVGTSHTFDFWVYGLHLRYLMKLDTGRQGPQTQTPWVDADIPGYALDNVMDAKDAEALGGILIVNEDEIGTALSEEGTSSENVSYDAATGTFDDLDTEDVEEIVYTDARTGIDLGKGGITSYDFNGDGTMETAAEMRLTTGIYVPLQGKGVTFTPVPGAVGSISDKGDAGSIEYAGETFPYDAVTDADGHAWVTVTSNAKGRQCVDGIVDYPANPAKGDQRVTGRACKTWTTQAEPEPKVVLTMNGIPIKPGEAEGPNNVYDVDGNLSSAHLEVHVLDEFGNELPDYEVVYEIVKNGQWTEGTQGAADTYHPLQVLVDKTQNEQIAAAKLVTRYPATGTSQTNATPGDGFEKLNPNATAAGTFSAKVINGNMWAWEFAAEGLAKLPAYGYTTYVLWAGDARLGAFTVGDNGSIPTGKIFGTTALGNIADGTVIWVTAENSATPSSRGDARPLAAAVEVTNVVDGNGPRPDNSEPRADSIDSANHTAQAQQTGVGPDDDSTDADWDDPYGIVTGYGGTESFFFDRFDPNNTQYPYCGTGAKAWTLNGIDPTKPHGSSIDIQLLEDPFIEDLPSDYNHEFYSPSNYYDPENGDPAYTEEHPNGVESDDDVRCIINVQVYKPADGMVLDGKPWKVFEVQKIWKSANITLAPEDAVNPVDADHTLTATVTDSAGNPVSGTEVTFTPYYESGVDLALAPQTGTTNADGEATATFPSNNAAVYSFVATAMVDGAKITSNVALKEWQERVATALSLDPETAVNLPGDDHELTATVLDQFDDPLENASVELAAVIDEGTVSFATSPAAEITNADGEATWTLTPGADQ